MSIFTEVFSLWKYRKQLARAEEINEAVKSALDDSATDARPIWKTYRFWSGVIMIAGTGLSIGFGAVTIEQALTPEMVAAVGLVVAGIVQILQAKGQVKTEKMIAAAAARTVLLSKEVSRNG